MTLQVNLLTSGPAHRGSGDQSAQSAENFWHVLFGDQEALL